MTLNMIKYNSYGFWGVFQLALFRLRSFFLFPTARLIRFPFRIRGKSYVSVGAGFTTGFNCRVDAFTTNITGDYIITIGKNVQINDYVHLAAIEKLEIGDNVLIASKVFVTDHNHGSYSGDFHDSPLSIPKERPLYSKPVSIEKNVWIGEFVCILPGVTIGEGSIIGAMSVVSRNIPPYSIAVGSPAKVIKKYDFETQNWIKV